MKRNFDKMSQPIDEINLLKNKIKDLEKKNNDLENDILKYKLSTKLFDYILDRQKTFVSKVNFVIDFLDFLGQNACVYGSFVRKLFDYSLRFDKIKNLNTGNIDNSDINVIYTNSCSYDKGKIIKNFYKTISIIKQLSFAGYVLEQINDVEDTYDINMKLIPHVYLKFKKVQGFSETQEETVLVNMYCWRIQDNIDFSLNNYILTSNGIQKSQSSTSLSYVNYTFLDYLYDLTHHKTKFIKDIEQCQRNAFPEDEIVLRETKVSFLKKIYNIISKQYVKILENEFTIYGYSPELELEKKEDCPITSVSSPYIKVKLECGHWVSLPAYKGIVEKGELESTESIKCPYCRKELKIKFTDKEYNRYEKRYMNILSSGDPSITNFRKNINEIISNDAFEQL